MKIASRSLVSCKTLLQNTHPAFILTWILVVFQMISLTMKFSFILAYFKNIVQNYYVADDITLCFQSITDKPISIEINNFEQYL